MDHSILVPEVSLGPAFCDWLTVTCQPESNFTDSVLAALDSLPTEISFAADYKQLYRILGAPRATCTLEQSRLFHSVSVSGTFLASLRQTSQLDRFLFAIASAPHTVTRLDVAKDYRLDFPVVLKALNAAYADGTCSLSRKALRVTEMLGVRSDGSKSGTWYAGRRQKGNITGRIYDKSLEMQDKLGVASPFPITRVEMTARKRVGCSLRDASNAEPLFYKLASPAFVATPPGTPEWVQGGGSFAWAAGPAEKPPAYPLLKYRMENSAEVKRLAALAAEMGDYGEEMAIRLLRAQIQAKRAQNGSKGASHA